MGNSRFELKAGLWSTIGGLAGSAGVQLLFPTVTASTMSELAVVGTGLGVGIDTMVGPVQQSLMRSVRTYRAIFDKVGEDLENSPLRSWTAISEAHSFILNRTLSCGLASDGDSRLAAASQMRALKRYLAYSDCWNGRPRTDSVRLLRANGPLIVSSTSHNAGVQAALTIMRDNFGVPIQVDGKYWHGGEQVSALNQGVPADFAIIVDSNVFLGSSERTSGYRFLLPCNWQRHKLIQRRKRRSYDKARIWFASGTSAEEQSLAPRSLADLASSSASLETAALDVTEMIGKLAELDYGEGMIAWEPLLTLHNITEPEFYLPTSDYQFSISLYCHRDLLSRAAGDLTSAFQDCLIASWNVAKSSQFEVAMRLAFGSDCPDNFSRIRSKTGPA